MIAQLPRRAGFEIGLTSHFRAFEGIRGVDQGQIQNLDLHLLDNTASTGWVLCTYSQHQREVDLGRRRWHRVEVALYVGAELSGAVGVDVVAV
jgi:hypothetical protein